MAGGNKIVQAKLKGDIISLPVYTGVLILRGQMVSINSAGFAVPANDTSGDIFAGIAEQGNTAAEASSSGKVDVKVRRKGIFKMRLETTKAAPTLVGSLVYVADVQTATNDEEVDIASLVTNEVLVGMIVKHGTDAQAAAGTSTKDIWVDILGCAMTVFDATYLGLTDAASHATDSGTELIGVEENLGWGATPTLQDVLEMLLLNNEIPIKIADFTEEDGTILTITADGTIGFKQLTNEEVILQVAAAEVFSVTIGLPSNADGAKDMTLSLMVQKNGADADDATIDLEAFAIATGAAALSSSDAYAGSAKAIVDNLNLQILDFTIANAQLPATPRTITFNLIPAGTDEIYIYGACLKYSKKFA